MDRKIKLIIGLGNPGPEYKNTYHSVGFLFIDFLEDLELPRRSADSNLRSLKSGVYMNESGRFVKKILKKYGLRPEDVLIAHDDSDLIVGKYKLSFDRGGAGHKGVESVIRHLGTERFWRLRIGVRPYTVRREKAERFVLKKISKENQEKMVGAIQDAIKEMGIL